MSHAEDYLSEVAEIARLIPQDVVERFCDELCAVRDRLGRLFIVGIGGSAANASHAAADFRHLCGIDAYAPTDNVSELTARTNDDGWGTIFSRWLKTSQGGADDLLLVLSVGGGGPMVSPNIEAAVIEATASGMKVLGIVGRTDGYTAKHADIALVIPSVNDKRVTPHAEAFQAVVWHCLVSHPKLQQRPTTW